MKNFNYKNKIYFFFRHLCKVGLNLVYAVSCLIPKKRQLYLFSSWFGERFSDNPKFIFEYALSEKALEIFWLTKEKELYERMRAKGYPVLYALSFKGIWMQMRAGGIVFSHSHWSEFYSCCIGHRTKRVQAWHGAPLKKIGKTDSFNTKSKLLQISSDLLFPHMREHFDLVLATGVPDKEVFEHAFNVSSDSIIVTGYPRNDVFTFNECLLAQRPQKLIYMPTFRGGLGSEFKLFNNFHFNFPLIDIVLGNNNADLYIKLHPVQSLSKETRSNIDNSKNIHLMDDPRDIYDILKDFDALISDYSSIFFDFLLSGKRIYMLPLDKDEYLKNDREMYYEYDDVCPSDPKDNWVDMLDYIFHDDYPIVKYKNLISRFHVHRDANSSERAYHAIVEKFL